MENKNKLIVLVSGVLVILLMVVSVSFAIFRFGETGESQELVLGDIWMKYEESNGIQLENALPGDEYEKYFEFYVTGTNTYTKKDIWYDISLVKGSVPSGKNESNRIGDKYLKFRLTEIVNGTETEIFTNKTYDDLTNKRIHVDKISKSTNEYSKTYRLYMTISEELTYGNAEGSILTTEEFGNIFGSVKVNVTGDFNKKAIAYEDMYDVTDESCFETEETITYEHNKNMTSEELELCVTYITDLGWEEYQLEGETIETFCDGTGTNGGYTFQKGLERRLFISNELKYFEENNIIIKEEGLVISDYDTSCGGLDVVIPGYINNTKVVEIGESSFYQKGLTSVVIPKTIIYIGPYPFANNNLTSVIFEDDSDLYQIEYSAFKNNQITQITLPDNLDSIETEAFLNNSITSVIIPDSVTYFACDAFDDFVTIDKSDNLTCTKIEHEH